jgi:hypothetical protein
LTITCGRPLSGRHSWFLAEDRGTGSDTIHVIMKDGKLFKNTLD